MKARLFFSIIACLVMANALLAQPSITILSPRDNERWSHGWTYPIRWAVTDVDSLRIEYSTTGAGGPWTLLAAGIPSSSDRDHEPGQNDTFTRTGSFYWAFVGSFYDSVYIRVSDKANPSLHVVKRILLSGFTHWYIQVSDVDQSLYATVAVSDQVFWAGGANGLILRTVDRGIHWQAVSMLEGDIHAIAALDPSSALVCSSPVAGVARIYRTRNGGSSWNPVQSTSTVWRSIHYFDAANAYALGDPVGGFWVLKRTTDGGSSWFDVQPPLPAAPDEQGEYNAMTWTDGTYGWFGTNTNKLYRTTDGGTTWLGVSLPLDVPDVTAVYFMSGPSPLTGLIGSGNGAIRRSTNGGATWGAETSRLPLAVLGLGGLLSFGPRECWAMSGGSVCYSQDTGRTWTSAIFEAYTGSTPLNQLSIGGQSTYGYGCAVGDSGTIVRFFRFITGVEPSPFPVPQTPVLEQNYPNPFNPRTEIGVQITAYGWVTLRVYDVLGREIATLVNEDLKPGRYERTFDAHGLSTGVYFCRLSSGNFTQTRKLLLVR